MRHNFDLPETKPSKVKIIIIIVAAILLYGLFAGVRANTSLLVTEISEFTGISYGEVSASFSTLNLVLAISVPLVGILTLKIQKFYLMLTGAVFCFIGFIGTAFSSTTAQLVLFIGIFLGFGCSLLCFSIVYSAAKPFVDEKTSSILAGILLASQGVMGMISSHAIDGFIEGFGLTLCLIIISVSALCLIPFTFLFIKRKKSGEVPVEESEKSLSIGFVLKKIVTNPFFYILILGSFAYGMGDGGLMNHTSQYIEELFESGEYSSSIVSVYTISVMVGALLGGYLGGKVKNKMLLCGSIFLIWAVLNGVIQILILNNSFGLSIPITTIVLTFATGFLINTTFAILIAIAVERVSLAANAPVAAILECGMFVAYSIDSFLGGMLHDIFGNFDLIDFIATFLAIFAGIAMIAYVVKHRNKKQEIIV